MLVLLNITKLKEINLIIIIQEQEIKNITEFLLWYIKNLSLFGEKFVDPKLIIILKEIYKSFTEAWLETQIKIISDIISTVNSSICYNYISLYRVLEIILYRNPIIQPNWFYVD